jgi:hypothetical protein
MIPLNQSDKLGITPLPQTVYDAFNAFVFSNDTRVLAKMLWRAYLFEKTKDVPGDIVECGVFKGSGLVSWLKIRQIFSPNAFKKVIGFDMFDTEGLIQSLEGQDKTAMAELFSGRHFPLTPDYLEVLTNRITSWGFNNFELIMGDITHTSKQYVEARPGAKISILYLDLDLAGPTYHTLNNLWSIMSDGGYVVFDEYGHHVWSESRGVDQFVKERGLKLHTLDSQCPTAYLIK